MILIIPPELLERVFLKLGGAETDEQLQNTLERFLVPTILKSGSQFKSVQNKVRCGQSISHIVATFFCQVLEILTHVNKRLHSRPAVLLPMATLLARFTDQDSSPQAAVSCHVNIILYLGTIQYNYGGHFETN